MNRHLRKLPLWTATLLAGSAIVPAALAPQFASAQPAPSATAPESTAAPSATPSATPSAAPSAAPTTEPTVAPTTPPPATAAPTGTAPPENKAPPAPEPAKGQAIEMASIAASESTNPNVSTPPTVVFRLGPVALSPLVLIQVQATPYIGQNAYFQAGDIAERPGFRLRRSRFGFGGNVAETVDFGLSVEVSTASDARITLNEAWMTFSRWKEFQISMGTLNVPFSRSAILSSAETALIDRALSVRAMAPFRQLGLGAGGALLGGKILYGAGIFNGFERSDLFYGGFVENRAPTGNRFDNLAYAARVSVEPLGRLGPSFDDTGEQWGGGSASRPSAPSPASGPFRLGVGGSYFFSDGGTRDVHSAEGDVMIKARGFHLLGEALWSTTIPERIPTQPTTQTETVDSLAIFAEAGYLFWQNRLSVNARFEWIDPNMRVQDSADNWLLTGGIGARILGDRLKAQLEFTHREEVHGPALENDALTLQTQFRL